MGPALPVIGALAAVLLCASATVAQDARAPAPGYAGVDLFQMPALIRTERQALAAAAAGDVETARRGIEALLKRFDAAAKLHADLAVLAAAAGDDDAALVALADADRLGFADIPSLMSRRPLKRLAEDPRFAELATGPTEAAPATPRPERALVKDGVAPVTRSNTYWDDERRSLVSRFIIPPIAKSRPLFRRPPEGPAQAELARLSTQVARGWAAGNGDDLYDNRDDGHSPLVRDGSTQVSRVIYGPEAKAAGLHYGLNESILFDHVTFGNSSTAVQGPFWRSLPRQALTTPGGPDRLWRLYEANHIYAYPEHRDHDPLRPRSDAAPRGHGDLFPANTPYYLVSRGSSGSDRPLLNAVRIILAALPPDAKTFLKERGLIAPMVQQIFRRGQTGIVSDKAYLSPIAHPAVFDGERIDLARMIALASAVKADEVPPVVRLRIESESGGPAFGDVDADGARALGERLFDTPSAIARVWRGPGASRRFVVSAGATEDPNGRPLTFEWRVLRGPAEGDPVSVNPLDEAGTRAEIILPWTEPFTGADGLIGSRVDIGVFAHNGAAWSAPAFFSMTYPGHQRRVYAPPAGPDAERRLLVVDHVPAERRGGYYDPRIWPRRDWADRFAYTDQGRLAGWTRTRANGPDERFTAHGLRVTETGAEGRAHRAEAVAYRIERTGKGLPVVEVVPTGRRFVYYYADAEDRIGAPSPAEE